MEYSTIAFKKCCENDIAYVKCLVQSQHLAALRKCVIAFPHFIDSYGLTTKMILPSLLEARVIDSVRGMPSLLPSLPIYPIPLN